MPLTAEQKKLITDPAILQEIEDTEKEVARLNYENSDRRTKYAQSEKAKNEAATKLDKLQAAMEKVGLNADEDIEEQFPRLIDKVTKEKGFKPSSEVEALSKNLEKLTKKLEAAEAQAAAEKRETMVMQAASQFDPALTESFGKAAPIIRDLLRSRGRFAIKDGVPGLQNGDEFIPLNAEKGSQSAIDLLKKDYADLVVTKQKPGTGGSGVTKTGGGNNDKLISREEFDQLPLHKRSEFFANGGQLAENQIE